MIKGGVYLLYGQETYLIKQFIKNTIDSIQHKDVNICTVNEFSETTISSCLQVPFLADYRLIIVEGELFKNKNEALLKYIEQPADSTILLLVPPSVDGRKALYKKLKKSDRLLEFKKLKGKELIDFIKQRTEKQGAKISKEAILMLIEKTGYEHVENTTLFDITNNIDKLISSNKGDITVEIVDKLVGDTINDNIFLLVDYIVKKEANKAYTHLDGLLLYKENTINLISLILRYFRIIYKIKCLNTQNKSIICKSLGIHPISLKNIHFNLTLDVIDKCINACVEKISGIKDGTIKDTLAIQILLAEILSFI
ncbi:MAG: DNA polymerase III subunit delta [Clostridia bacterium]|nr:DNA polymerase III subunit delta [Clostridia bacterium]